MPPPFLRGKQARLDDGIPPHQPPIDARTGVRAAAAEDDDYDGMEEEYMWEMLNSGIIYCKSYPGELLK